MTKTIGVIGLGSIGMRHAKNLKDMGHIVLGYDPDLSRMIALNQAHNVAMTQPTVFLKDVIRKSDAIVIASPTQCHLDHIMSCKFKQPIFVEKPIAHKMDESLSLMEPIMVGYNLRFHSCVKKAKEWLDAGLIGEPLWANFTVAQYSDKPPYLRDGVILNWSHELDLALYLLGNASVAASSTRLTEGHDDMSDILLTHENGCRTTVHLDYLTKHERRFFYIQGSNGSISADLVYHGPDGQQRRICLGESDGKVKEFLIGKDTYNENYIEEMQAFIDRIDGKETIGCTGEEALKVLEICLEVRKQAGL